jgi:hypothetical protein
MKSDELKDLPRLLELLGLDEPPMGIFYTDEPPAGALSPKPGDLPTREKEIAGTIDWKAVFENFSCVMGHIWRARKKQLTAAFESERFGCPGGAFWLGFMKPQSENIVHYVSSGIPGYMEGEHYCESPDQLRRIFETIDPPAAPGRYCVVKPVTMFGESEQPDLVAFFARPESLSGLHQLATFVTNDPEVVASPWGAACTGLITWPYKYLLEGRTKAVVSGWDPSARKFFKTDELSFVVPRPMFEDMLERFGSSFLVTRTWGMVRKKIERSRKVWGEQDV